MNRPLRRFFLFGNMKGNPQRVRGMMKWAFFVGVCCVFILPNGAAGETVKGDLWCSVHCPAGSFFPMWLISKKPASNGVFVKPDLGHGEMVQKTGASRYLFPLMPMAESRLGKHFRMHARCWRMGLFWEKIRNMHAMEGACPHPRGMAEAKAGVYRWVVQGIWCSRCGRRMGFWLDLHPISRAMGACGNRVSRIPATV